MAVTLKEIAEQRARRLGMIVDEMLDHDYALLLGRPSPFPRKTSEEWAKECGIQVCDPDSWRNADIPWDKPITKSLFEQLVAKSTVKFLRK